MTGRHNPAQRPELLAELRRRYEAGATVRQLALETGCAFSTMHARLVAAGAAFRTRGGTSRTSPRGDG